MRPVTLLLPLLACAPACTWWKSAEHVLVTSDPAGARILVDGTDSGHTTPFRLRIGGNFGSNHEVVLQKKGYRPAARWLVQHTEGYTSRLRDAAFDLGMSALPPFFWTPGDLLFPFGVRGAALPGELHVVLEKEDAPKLGFDLLAERAAAAKAATSPNTADAR